jgi:Serine/threonine protein kinase involved in cell cycle control
LNVIVKRSERRIKDRDDIKVVDSALDNRTAQAAIEVMRKLKLRKVFGSIASGKESRLYPAVDGEGKFYALKIYYISAAASKRSAAKYVAGDPRFEGIEIGNTKELVYVWAKKEFKNLIRMAGAGVRVPQPYMVFRNVLAMEFLGEGPRRSPLLREVPGEEIDENIYIKLLEQLEIMVTKARLIHGDLSEYNVIIHEGEPYIIDVGQAVTVEHRNAEELLRRDLSNINNFFEKLGMRTVDVNETVKELINKAERGISA